MEWSLALDLSERQEPKYVGQEAIISENQDNSEHGNGQRKEINNIHVAVFQHNPHSFSYSR